MRKIWLALLSMMLLSSFSLKADWWGDKYSMFVHYGLYSIPAGVWNGNPVKEGYSEQILTFGIGFSDWYEAYTREFDAKNFDAEAIVALAKKAGMRSVVMTAKHHDGFCLFHTQTTSYNSFDGTPARRDLIGELAEACHRNGLGFGIYFSLIDWHFPAAVPFSSHNADPITPAHHEYNMAQVTELLTKYGAVDELWFDMGSLLPAQSEELYRLVHKLQPKCMVSGRLGNDYADFCVMPDNQFPDYDMILPWQTAASIFPETWGYRSWQERGEVSTKVNEKLEDLVNVVSRGGKYLLNIGPMGDGGIVPFEYEVLSAIGRELEPISEAIYNTLPTPYEVSTDVPSATLSQDKKDLYLFFRKDRHTTVLPRTLTPIKEAKILNAKGNVKIIRQKGDSLTLDIEGQRPYFTVVKVTFDEPLRVDKPICQHKTLSPLNATPLYAQSAVDYYSGFRSILGYQWHLPSVGEKVKVAFTDGELGRKFVLRLDENEGVTHTFVSEQTKTVKFNPKTIKWQALNVVIQRGLFGSVSDAILSHRLSDKVKWQAQPMTMKYESDVYDRTAVYLRYEIEAQQAVELPLRLSYRDGLLIYLDGTYFEGDLARPMDDKSVSTRTVLIPLSKGKHTLLFKVYSRWAGLLGFSMESLTEYHRHTMTLPVPSMFARPTTLSIIKEKSVPLASPARLNNVRVVK